MHPPAKANPLISAIVGIGKTNIFPNNLINSSKKLCLSLTDEDAKYYKSNPPEKILSFKVEVIIANGPSIDSISSKQDEIARTNSGLKAFAFPLLKIRKTTS